MAKRGRPRKNPEIDKAIVETKEAMEADPAPVVPVPEKKVESPKGPFCKDCSYYRATGAGRDKVEGGKCFACPPTYINDDIAGRWDRAEVKAVDPACEKFK